MNLNPAALAARHDTKPKDDPPIWRAAAAWWAQLQPHPVIDTPRKQPGRPRSDARARFAGVLGVARTGGQWPAVPRAFGPQSTGHARCRAWVEQSCCAKIRAVRLEVFDGEVGRAWRWQAAAGCLGKALRGTKGGPARRRGQAAPPPPAARAAPNATCGPLARGAAGGGASRGQPHRHGEAGRPARRQTLRPAAGAGAGGGAFVPRPGLRLRRMPPGGTRPAAGWSRAVTRGATASGGGCSAGSSAPTPTSASSSWPPA